ncbi:transposase [Corallincola luteus]|uniref:Transposase n=1 Tax=Corallincola luteus TaxID=1775177 RepID=A0ABY2AFU8_9GAMM|nr:transposase [Corallincola luteus]TCI01092.1 transposase [Corallincola luteus]
MTRPRSELVSPADTPYYHCVCRCVRRAFLCGEDRFTNTDYSHRKAWVLERLALLDEVFTIELCAYAVMSNHYHLVVHLNPKKAEQLTDREVSERWAKLFNWPIMVGRYLAGKLTTDAEKQVAIDTIQQWRERLSDISWYMRCLNEHIARKANEEDQCKGRFWEGRFKSQAILDEAGLLACMAYVDLNPLRAGIVDTPEQSVDVSIHQRLQQYQQGNDSNERQTPPDPTDKDSSDTPKTPLLQAFFGNHHQDKPDGIPFSFADYLELVDWTGRAQRNDKRGSIPKDTPPILGRLGLDAETFIAAIQRQNLSRGTVIGNPASRKRYAQTNARIRVYGPALTPPTG